MKHDDSNTHIDDETLAAFVDNRLLGTARDDVMAHLVTCDRCRKTIMEAAQMKQRSPRKEEKKMTRILARYVAPMAIAASLLLVILPSVQNDHGMISKGGVGLEKQHQEADWLDRAKQWIREIIQEITGGEDE